MSGSSGKNFYIYSSDMNKAQEVNVDLKGFTEEQLRQELSRRNKERKRKAKRMVQCSGKNKRGTQCGRKADPSIGYCFYHLQDKQETPIPAPRQIKEVLKPIPAPRQIKEVVKPIPAPRQRKEVVKPIPAPRETSAFPIWKPTPTPRLTAFRGWDKSYSLGIENKELDPKYILTTLKPQIKQVIEDGLKESNNIKIATTMQIEFNKSTINEKEEAIITAKPYFTTRAKTIDKSTDLDDAIRQIIEEQGYRIESYEGEASYWIYQKTDNFFINTSKYTPLRGSSYINLPIKVKNTKSVINIKNNDDKCFMWSVLAHLYPACQHKQRVSKYRKYENTLNF